MLQELLELQQLVLLELQLEQLLVLLELQQLVLEL